MRHFTPTLTCHSYSDDPHVLQVVVTCRDLQDVTIGVLPVQGAGQYNQTTLGVDGEVTICRVQEAVVDLAVDAWMEERLLFDFQDLADKSQLQVPHLQNF